MGSFTCHLLLYTSLRCFPLNRNWFQGKISYLFSYSFLPLRHVLILFSTLWLSSFNLHASLSPLSIFLTNIPVYHQQKEEVVSMHCSSNSLGFYLHPSNDNNNLPCTATIVIFIIALILGSILVGESMFFSSLLYSWFFYSIVYTNIYGLWLSFLICKMEMIVIFRAVLTDK